MKKVFAVILSALMLLSCASAMAEGTFRVGMECNYAPYNWTQAEPSEFTVPIEGGGGYADGYDVQIAKLIAEGLGKELVIVKTEWDGLPMGVMSGAFDAIIAGMSPTEERKATLDFSDPYRTNKLVVVVKKDSPYASATSLEELSGAKMCIRDRAARRVQILDAQQKPPARMARGQIRQHRAQQVAQMQPPAGRRREAPGHLPAAGRGNGAFCVGS